MPSTHVLDTCCFINVYASGQATALLKAVGGTVVIPEAVKREALYLAPPHPDEKPTPVVIDHVITELNLQVVAPANEEELALYVALAPELDDGEAMGLALAKERGLVLMTDERKARRKAVHLGVQVLTTCDVVALWSEAAPDSDVTEVVRNIGVRARYAPGPKDPKYDWWVRRASS